LCSFDAVSIQLTGSRQWQRVLLTDARSNHLCL
jgi:hypothetical protein